MRVPSTATSMRARFLACLRRRLFARFSAPAARHPPARQIEGQTAHFFFFSPVSRVDPFFAAFSLFFAVARIRFDGAFFFKKIEHRAPLLGTRANERVALHAPGLAIKTLNRVGVYKKSPVGEKVLRTASKGTRRRRRARSHGACAPTDRGRTTPTFGVAFRGFRRRLQKGLHRRWRSMYSISL